MTATIAEAATEKNAKKSGLAPSTIRIGKRYRANRLNGDYDAIVLTEMVEIRDAIRYFDSPIYLARWAERALAARPALRRPWPKWPRVARQK